MIYNTKFGQTLAQICDEIHLENPDYLRDFHNKNCPLPECFESDAFKGARVFIPNKQGIEDLNRKIRANNESFYDFPEKGQFPFAYDLWDGTYQISQTTYLNDEIISSNRHTVRLQLEEVKDNCFYFRFTAFDFKKNNEISEGKASTLARMGIDSMYPIRIVVNSEGEISAIELIKNSGHISSELQAIKQFFTDDFSSDYIEKMKEIVENPKKRLQKFGNTLLSTFLFGSFYRVKLGIWTTSPIYYDVYPWIFDAAAIRFELQNTLCPKENFNDEWIKIKQKGICYDHRSLESLYRDSEWEEHIPLNEKSIDCEHFAEYIFRRSNYSLQRIEAVFRNFIHDNIEKEIFLLERIADHN